MLRGEAKTAYQREYMRRRRAGLKAMPATKRDTNKAKSEGTAQLRIRQLERQLAAAQARIEKLKQRKPPRQGES
jgi:predicted alpha/beta-hydrolase family hydrolase